MLCGCVESAIINVISVMAQPIATSHLDIRTYYRLSPHNLKQGRVCPHALNVGSISRFPPVAEFTILPVFIAELFLLLPSQLLQVGSGLAGYLHFTLPDRNETLILR